MSVPTKTRREIIKETSEWIGSNRQTKEQINSLNEEWVLLEDHQKEITRKRNPAIILDEEAQNAFKLQLSKEGWLSPEQLKEKIEKFIQVISIENGFEDPQSITGHRAVLVLTIRERLRNEFNKFFGVGGAKPK